MGCGCERLHNVTNGTHLVIAVNNNNNRPSGHFTRCLGGGGGPIPSIPGTRYKVWPWERCFSLLVSTPNHTAAARGGAPQAADTLRNGQELSHEQSHE